MAAATPLWYTRSRRRVLLFCFLYTFHSVRAQNATTNASLDPSEERALNAIFDRWEISAPNNQWNISGQLCSGVAIDATQIEEITPGIKCDCSFNRSTICHISALRIFELDVGGLIPDEIWTFTYLTNLDLRRNYFIGPLSASIGNLTRLQYFTVGINALSGELPRELGLLTDLRSLSVTANNFSGPLPSEIGNLRRLTQMYFHSAGVSGPIPETFSNLRSIERMWAMDNELTGQIPDFIGNWSRLIQLRLQGNSFSGSIPQSFSRLTTMNDLRVSDLSNWNSSLDFLRNMTSLATLVLRNNKISGSIPSYFGELQSLTLLDLSFNNLTGRIPDSLFNLSSLTNLFLGNNSLIGELPSVKSPSLQTIDLSYNELSGSFPSWIGGQNLQLNLVSNNFNIDSNSNGSSLRSGLNCLQRNFPCYRGAPIFSRFAVKCGGPQVTSSNGLTFEMDNETLGSATYYMSNSGRWAVSNVGLVADGNNSLYTSGSSSQFTNTLDPLLFQSNRLSAGSLRYYGLGLENGNYTVRLFFAETTIIRNGSWWSLGRRVFNIYIQGILEEEDFDIRREAGGVDLKAVTREFTAEVLDNHLEVHLFWAGKGTCCVPAPGTYGPLISAISATPNFNATVSDNPPGSGRGRNRSGLIAGIVAAVAAVSLFAFVAVYFVVRSRRKPSNSEDEELLDIDARPYTFSYAELRAATNDFSPDNKLGEGGFGAVYKGLFGDGKLVAVKRLSVTSNQGKNQFLAEIKTITAVQHRNLVKLYGCCIEGDNRMLVYEYLENNSLDHILFVKGCSNLFLNWDMRFEICLGVARGLAYLHEESRLRIVHRDVKASNILLDSDLTPKISDFGLAKLYDDNKTHISTNVVAGTYGYLAPEYAMRGHLTEKVDVFSFGIVVLEIISGRPNSDASFEDERIYLLEWTWILRESNKEIELVDPRLDGYDANEVLKMIDIALLCTQASPVLRPSMSRVVGMLSGDIEVPSVITRPGYLTDWRFNDVTTIVTKTTDSSASNFDTTADTTMVMTGPTSSPVHSDKPILPGIIDED